MQKLFESLNISDELKQELSEKFENAINEKAEILAESKAEELFEAKKENFINETADKLDDYLSIVAEEYAGEIAKLKENNLKVQKAETIIEGVGAVLTAAGIDVATIVKIAEDGLNESSEDNTEYFEMKKQLDNAINEKVELKREKTELIKAGIVLENAIEENLSLMETEKLKKLAEKLDQDLTLEEFNESVLDLIETIKNEGSTEPQENIQESFKKETSSFIPEHLL